MDDLVELEKVVRRVIAARVRDAHVIEDLTQETLVQVAAADPQRTPSARQAYAIVTARNLVVTHARRRDVHDRHAHRLVEYRSLDGPEELTLEREETEALTAALDRLDPDDRQLLVRHESEGTPIDTLAAERAQSRGAVAMRLARARATLRVEFVIALRRARLPTERCRPVLVSLSAGDRRAQHRLAADDHLRRCPTCAELAGPVAERRRGIAAWLIVPVAEAIRRAVRSLRHDRVTQVVTATVVSAAAIGTLTVLSRSPAPPEPVATASATTIADRSVPSTTPPSSGAVAPACAPPAPLAADTPMGCTVGPTAVVVVEVPADEGFWARTADGQTIWVELVGPGESPVDIEPNATLVVAGTLRPPPPGSPLVTDPRLQPANRVLESPYEAVAVG